MATIPATSGGKLTCEPNQLGSVVVQQNGTVDAKCENVPAHLMPFPTRRPSSPQLKLSKEHKNWILSVVYGTNRDPLKNLSMSEEKVIENLGGTVIHPESGIRIKISIQLPAEVGRGAPTPRRMMRQKSAGM